MPEDTVSRSATVAPSARAEHERPQGRGGHGQALRRSGEGSSPVATGSYRRAVFRVLSNLARGRLTLAEGRHRYEFGMSQEGEIDAAIRVLDPAFYRRVVLGGSLGAAETYMEGLWQTGDLVAVMRLFARNAEETAVMDRGWALVTWPLRKAFNLLRRNSKRGSRRNIHEHYDLGNEFFGLFLDDTMTYSSGIFERPDSTLREASLAKYDRICRKLHLCSSDHVIEIGTGWGGFAIHAATQYGCRVTTTTISRRQHDFARRRVADAGLADRVQVLCLDYRDLAGQYDKLVSIEMIEAVGHRYLPAFFTACDRLLKPDGAMALQAITIPDQRYDRYRKTTDFIQRYIFPGGCLPSVGAMCRSLAKGTSLRIVHLEDFASHYARTLACWRERFLGQSEAIRGFGFDERFLRCWEYYFCYCEAAFAERQVGVSQITLGKPDSRIEVAPGGLRQRETAYG